MIHTTVTSAAKNLGATSALSTVAALLFGASECNWGKETAERWKEAKSVYCTTIEDMVKDRDKQCSRLQDPVARWQCETYWNSIINPARGQKTAAATAYLRCDDDALKKIEDWFKKIGDLAKAAKNLADAIGRTGSAIDNLVTVTLADLDIQVLTQQTNGTFGAGPVDYVATGASSWSIHYNNSAWVDQMSLAGTFQFDTVNLGAPVAGDTYDVGANAMSIQMSHLNRVITMDLDVDQPSKMQVVFDGASFVGTLQAFFVNDENGTWAAHFPVQFDLAGNFSIATAGAVPGTTIFPVSPKSGGNALSNFSADSDFRVGVTSRLYCDGLDAGTELWIWGAHALAADPNQTMAGLPWKLDTNSQQFFAAPVANANGSIEVPVAIPNDPSLQGLPLIFQGAGNVGGVLMQTSTAGSTIQ